MRVLVRPPNRCWCGLFNWEKGHGEDGYASSLNSRSDGAKNKLICKVWVWEGRATLETFKVHWLIIHAG